MFIINQYELLGIIFRYLESLASFASRSTTRPLDPLTTAERCRCPCLTQEIAEGVALIPVVLGVFARFFFAANQSQIS